MTISIQSTGPEASDDEVLTESERFFANDFCKKVFTSWELAEDPNDWVDLLTLLNGGIARGLRELRQRGVK